MNKTQALLGAIEQGFGLWLYNMEEKLLARFVTVNKKLISILLMLVFSTGFLFATVDMNGGNGFNTEAIIIDSPDAFNKSAKSFATGGVFESEIDFLTAGGIFNVERTFFSAGYLPSLGGAGAYDGIADDSSETGTMSFFFATPIKDNMILGVAAEYKMYSIKDGYASTTGFNTDNYGYGSGLSDIYYGKPNDEATVGVDTVSPTNPLYRSELTAEYSDFNARIVFAVENLAFHYRISRSSVLSNYTHDLFDSGETVASGVRTDNWSEWQHEVAFAYDGGSYKTYVPIGIISKTIATNVVIFNYLSDETDYYYGYGTGNFSSDNNLHRNESWLYVNPEITFDVEVGMLTSVKAGVDMDFGLEFWNLAGYTYNEFDIYAEPTLEKSLWDEKIDLVIKPKLGFSYIYDHVKYSSGNRYHEHYNPYIETTMATLVRPTEWLELRFGLNYNLDWNIASYSSYGEYIDQHWYTSEFNAYTGFGINIGEYLSIDVFLQAGHNYVYLSSATIGEDGTVVSDSNSVTSDLFSINAYGLQLTYRFGNDD